MRTVTAMLVLGGCGRGAEYEGGDTSTIEAVECGADLDTSVGYRVEGTASDLETGVPAAEGLCVTAIDPASVLTGGDPTVLSAAQICAGGEFVIANIMSVPSVGMFIVVDDCEGEADTVMRTATSIPPEDLEGLGDGGALTGISSLVVSGSYQATIDADLVTAGYVGEPSVDGYLAGFTLSATEEPISGVRVECAGACTPYYFDADPSDGLFQTGGANNTETSAAAGAGFIIPGAPLFNYTFTSASETWDTTLAASAAGYGAYIRFHPL